MPQSIGNLLKKSRETKGISLEEVSEKTHIPRRVLIAIEEEIADDTISGFYLKGFIKSYAKFLNISDDIIRQYLQIEPQKSKVLPADSDVKKERFFSFLKYKKYIIGFIILSACIFMITLMAKKIIFVVHKKTTPATTMGKKIIPLPKETQGFELSAEITANNWVQVTGDGEVLFKGVLRKGAIEKWRVKKEIRLWVSDAGGITLKIDGRNINPLGKKGEKRSNLLITKDGLKE